MKDHARGLVATQGATQQVKSDSVGGDHLKTERESVGDRRRSDEPGHNEERQGEKWILDGKVAVRHGAAENARRILLVEVDVVKHVSLRPTVP